MTKKIKKLDLSVSALPSLTPEQGRVKPWFAVNGDETLRVNYPLKKNSVVYDLGGYEGEWSARIAGLYDCNIYVFEPVIDYANKLIKKFNKNKKIHVYGFGLAGRSKQATIAMDLASSSIYKKGQETVEIKLVEATSFIKKTTPHINLMKVNIEGGEYELLEHLISSGAIKNISSIQVQFHIFVPNASARRKSIHRKLSNTHSMTYNYPFIWENWRLK